MITIAGQVHIKPEKREPALKLLLGMAAASQAEEGCYNYQFYGDLENPNCFFLYELWDSQTALDAHGQTEHMAHFRANLPDLLAEPIALKRYTTSEIVK